MWPEYVQNMDILYCTIGTAAFILECVYQITSSVIILLHVNIVTLSVFIS